MKAGMLIPRKIKEIKDFNLRNAYSLNLEIEYNTSKSLLHPNWMKMYAELTEIKTVRSIG